jgi:hypothetical protein
MLNEAFSLMAVHLMDKDVVHIQWGEIHKPPSTYYQPDK